MVLQAAFVVQLQRFSGSEPPVSAAVQKLDFWEESLGVQTPKHPKCYLFISCLAFIRSFARLNYILNIFFITIFERKKIVLQIKEYHLSSFKSYL